ncbi:MAG: hypothetical protein KGK16_12090 [Bradyrhizobium sp.]|nr:hypothetical protein [Bradyrhizobium sp.]
MLALIAAIAISGFAISVRLGANDGMQANMHASRVLKAQVLRRQPTATSFAVHQSALFQPAFSRLISRLTSVKLSIPPTSDGSLLATTART